MILITVIIISLFAFFNVTMKDPNIGKIQIVINNNNITAKLKNAAYINDKKVVEKQYATSANLNTRISIHDKYSTNKQGFGNWIYSNYEIETAGVTKYVPKSYTLGLYEMT